MYQYKFHTFGTASLEEPVHQTEAFFNLLGEDGWSLVTILSEGSEERPQYVAIFRRRGFGILDEQLKRRKDRL